MGKELITVISENTDIRELIRSPNFYKDVVQLNTLTQSPVDLYEICDYMNRMHNPHNIFYEVGKNNTSIVVKGEKSIFNYFTLDPETNKMIPDLNYPSINRTCINQTDIILDKLKEKDVSIVTSLQNEF